MASAAADPRSSAGGWPDPRARQRASPSAADRACAACSYRQRAGDRDQEDTGGEPVKEPLGAARRTGHPAVMPAGQHEFVDHSKGEYVRGDAHTNTLEGFFSVFKRGLIGVYQHVEEQHLDRYLAEFDFRYNNRQKLGIDDQARADHALVGGKGKRLTYETTRRQIALDTPPF